MKKITLLSGGLGIAFAVMLLVSSAQTVTASGTTAAGTSSASGPMYASCAPFSRSLSIGATGSDVAMLQAYLVAHGYLNVSPTGYFGLLTRAAVGRWQAENGVTVEGSAGSGIFGPLSRASFARSCSGTSTTSADTTFSSNPQSGPAPLTVQFTSSAPQASNIGSTVAFGDGTSGALAFAPTCANCNALGVVSHTYATPGTYTATLSSGSCACPVGGACHCPMIQVLSTTMVTVGPIAVSTPAVMQVNGPGGVTLSAGGIAEVRSGGYYFTLESLSTNSATIQITPVGCWNSFPSDPPPAVRCMLAPVPIPPQTLSIGQTYPDSNFNVTLTAISNGEATFEIH